MDIREVVEHVCYRIANTPVRTWPFPHFYVTGVFPAGYYRQILDHWPEATAFVSQADSGRSSAGAYRERQILSLLNGNSRASGDPFWNEFADWFTGPRFMQLMTMHFKPWIDRSRQLPPRVSVEPDGMLVQDCTGYEISPHTDARQRLVSSLFYCPADATQRHLGTSLYIPRDQGPVPGISGRHYDRQHFVRAATMDFMPNSLFGFVVGPRSFHGVEPVRDPGVRRNLILHYVRLSSETLAAMPPEDSATT
ncbi:MAG: hypothetical protein ACOY33_05180 [Pseudomonadota bacterium]